MSKERILYSHVWRIIILVFTSIYFKQVVLQNVTILDSQIVGEINWNYLHSETDLQRETEIMVPLQSVEYLFF